MLCAYFKSGLCRSCTRIEQPYDVQLVEKQARCVAALVEYSCIDWLAPVVSAEMGFRNKAKMVVSGSCDAPVLGILDGGVTGAGVDLTGCPLYPQAIQAAFAPIMSLIRAARLAPYDIARRQGELKHALLTYSERDNELMLRFVLRSSQALPEIRRHLPQLHIDMPNIGVVSANIQPIHQAIIEGPEEIPLTERQTLTMWLNDLPLYVRPRSFFQTNSAVAERLYATAQGWIAEIAPAGLWDLFCGVGGFALHAARVVPGPITGIEVSTEAIASAELSARQQGFDQVTFRALSADEFVQGRTAVPPLVIVNPPRRGLGAVLCAFLADSTAQWLIYSSCNPESLVRDIRMLTGFVPVRAQMFDIFPHTDHCEVLVLLVRQPGGV